jgi:predicted aspartyl protease
MRAVLGLLILLIFSLAPVRAAEPVASVPYRIDYNGWLTVQVMVNGQGPYDFIIDTGASQSLVFQNLAELVEFHPTGGALQTVIGLSAQQPFPPYYVGEVKIGNVGLDSLVTIILPDWSVEHRPHGIIGLDFLMKYICVFDADNETLSFYDHSSPPDDEVRRWKRAPLKADDFGLGLGTLYTIEAKVNQRRVNFLFDLGASGTVINRTAAGAVSRYGFNLTIRPSGGDARARVTDALEESDAATSMRASKFQVGNHYWYRRILTIFDAPIFDELGVQQMPFGLFGADLVRDRSFSLDFEGEEMRIGRKKKKN